MNRKLSKLELTIILGFSLLIGVTFVYLTNGSYNVIVKDVPYANREMEVKGVIVRTMPVKGSVKIWFKDGCKVLITAGYNYHYHNNYITNFLQINDSLVKHSGSDSIFIFRESKAYFFLLNKDVYEK